MDEITTTNFELSKDMVLELLQKIENISFYPIHLYQDGVLIENVNTATGIKEDPFLCDPSLVSDLLSCIAIHFDPVDPYIFYCIGKFPFKLTCIIGPLTTFSLDTKSTNAYMKRHNMHNFHQYHIMHASIPQANDTLILIEYIILGVLVIDRNIIKNELHKYLEASMTSATNDSDYAVLNYKLSHADQDIPHFSYKLEQKIFKAVENGDETEITKMLIQGMNYSLGSFASSSLKLAEYSSVAAITLLARAAIAGGVYPADSYDLSDSFLKKISLCKDINGYNEIINKAFSGYLSMVKKAKSVKNQSIYIRNCKTYISQNLNIALTPDLIAEHLGISKDYLLHMFPKYEGTTLMNYIQKERITAAENMLKYSDCSIIQIANRLGFQTQSHFGVLFKRRTGMSPASYRRQNKPVGF